MGASTKALVQLALIFCILGSLGVWLVVRPTPTIWIWRLSLVAGIIATSVIWFRAAHKKENLPDLLAYVTPGYFERDGLCFAPVIEVANGVCWIAIYFQNRYAHPCSCTVSFFPPLRTLWFGRHNLPPIHAVLNCPGAAVGVTRFTYPVPKKYQGRHWKFEVYASNTYPQGKGAMLRFRDGIQAGSNASFTITRSRCIARIYFPHDVAADARVRSEATEILWQPDLPTNAFPVIPMAQRASEADHGFLVDPVSEQQNSPPAH